MSTFTENIVDCLVLKLEEFKVESNEIDTTLYILYDTRKDMYLIRGERKWTLNRKFLSYSFECESVNDLADFIEYVVPSHNLVNEVLYNYDNFPENSNDITYDFLHDYDHSDYEISGYNDKKLKRSRLLRNLRILRNIFNYY